jgi:hypothetical protein
VPPLWLHLFVARDALAIRAGTLAAAPPFLFVRVHCQPLISLKKRDSIKPNALQKNFARMPPFVVTAPSAIRFLIPPLPAGPITARADEQAAADHAARVTHVLVELRAPPKSDRARDRRAILRNASSISSRLRDPSFMLGCAAGHPNLGAM